MRIKTWMENSRDAIQKLWIRPEQKQDLKNSMGMKTNKPWKTNI